MAVLFSSDAQESRKADAVSKIKNQTSLQKWSSTSMWPCCSENPLKVSKQLLLFRSHDTTGAIDVFLLRAECQQVDHFVGALWICSEFSGVGTGATIR